MTEQSGEIQYEIRRITITRKDLDGNVIEVIEVGETDASDDARRRESSGAG